MVESAIGETELALR